MTVAAAPCECTCAAAEPTRRTVKMPMGNRQPEGNEKRHPAFAAGSGKMRPMTAATRSGSTPLAGPTRAREPKRVWEWPVWIRPCSRNMPAGMTACCAGLGISSPYQLAVMWSSHNGLTRKPYCCGTCPNRHCGAPVTVRAGCRGCGKRERGVDRGRFHIVRNKIAKLEPAGKRDRGAPV